MTSTLLTTTAAQDTEALKAAWQTINSASCPQHYNFHLHSVFSDGKLTPQEIVDQAIAMGLSGFAITDHHTVKGSLAAQRYLATQPITEQVLPHLWTGIEINGYLLNTKVHILGYGFDPHHPALAMYSKRERQEGENAEAINIVNAIHEADGLVILAHPARYRRPAEELIPAAVELGFDGIEAYYAYDHPNPWRPSPNRTATMEAIAEQYDHLWLTCGTDAHGTNINLKSSRRSST